MKTQESSRDRGTYGQNFGDKFQIHALAVLARTPGSILRFRGAIDSKYFSGDLPRLVSRALFAHVDKYQTLPSEASLAEEVKAIGSDDNADDCEALVARLYRIDIRDQQSVLDKLIDFGRTQAMVNAVLEGVKHIENGQPEKMLALVQGAQLVGQDVMDLGIDYKTDLDRLQFYMNPVDSDPDAIPTGIRHLDLSMKGGLSRGEMGVILAPPKRGKSTTLINIGFGALTSVKDGRGYNVVHYTCEMNADKVSRRYDARLAGPCYRLRNDDPVAYIEAMKKRTAQYLRGRLFIKRYPTRTLTPSMMRSHLSLLASQDFHPDVIIVDYADILKAERRIGELRHEVAGIYEDLRTIAGEYNAVLWTGSQSKQSSLEKSTITMADFAEAFEKAAIVDAAIAFCLPYNQGVVTDRGLVKIGDLKKLLRRGSVKALSHNFKTGCDEWKPIVNWFDNGSQVGGWLRVRTDVRGTSKGTVTTKDHEYFLPNGTKVQAKDLRVGQQIAGREYVLSSEQHQVLIGTMLGDGYLNSKGALRLEHGDAQKYYIDWKLRCFSDLGVSIRPRDLDDAFGTRRSWQGIVNVCPTFKRMRQEMYESGEKAGVDRWLSKLDSLGLSVWLMDDGSLSRSDNRITLHYQSYSDADRLAIQNYFAHKWKCYGKEYRKRFQFDTKSSHALLDLVGGLLTPCQAAGRETKTFSCPQIACGSFEASTATITEIAQVNPKRNTRYDIEVADNHNFYTGSGVLVSNCQTPEERMEGRCRLFNAAMRNHGDGLVIQCAVSRPRCRLQSLALMDMNETPISEEETEQDDILQSRDAGVQTQTKTMTDAKEVARRIRAAGKPARRI